MTGKHTRRGQISDVGEVRVDAPQVSRQPQLGRDANLRGVAVPLGPGSFRTVRQVQRANGVTALPATVRRLSGPREGLDADTPDAPPRALDVNDWRGRLDQERTARSGEGVVL